jgi:aryl-alcohol dehydrogenase-like predicted oxidoreductase
MTQPVLTDGRPVRRIGLGGWAIGGPFLLDGRPDGWGDVDDAETVRAIHMALATGPILIDTADVYGTGHSESVIGEALRGRRSEAFIATKFGFKYDAAKKSVAGTDVTPAYIEQALACSLERLGTDYIDLYQIHVGDLDDEVADRAAEALDRLAATGRIRAWGWSTDDAEAAARQVGRPAFAGVQAEINLFRAAPAMLELAEAEGLSVLIRSPLAMGMLTGKFDAASRLAPDDVRAAGHGWVRFFADGRPIPDYLDRLAALRDLLTSGGRSLTEGALGWLLAVSPVTYPVPGFKNEKQAAENIGALEKGPLPKAAMDEIEGLLNAEAVA